MEELKISWLPCRIFAKPRTAHRPVILMLLSLLVENKIYLKKVMPEFHQHIDCATRGINTGSLLHAIQRLLESGISTFIQEE